MDSDKPIKPLNDVKDGEEALLKRKDALNYKIYERSLVRGFLSISISNNSIHRPPQVKLHCKELCCLPQHRCRSCTGDGFKVKCLS